MGLRSTPTSCAAPSRPRLMTRPGGVPPPSRSAVRTRAYRRIVRAGQGPPRRLVYRTRGPDGDLCSRERIGRLPRPGGCVGVGANRHIQAAEVVGILGPIGPRPASETVARELTPLADDAPAHDIESRRSILAGSTEAVRLTL